MNNSDEIKFNNSDSNNDNLLKENTPETVDYDKLYNIQKENDNSTNIDNVQNMPTNSINTTMTEVAAQNIGSNNIVNNTPNEEIQENEPKKNNGLLFVGAIFVILMGIIIFLFPFIAKFLL